MRAATLVRIAMILMFVASIGVAGTTVVLRTAETFLAQSELLPAADAADEQPVQADQLERQLRSYQVRLAADGNLTGRVNILDPITGGVTTAQDMTIALLQNGNVVHEVHPGLEGRFTVAGVQPGVYSVVGAGPDGYIAYALSVLPAELTVDNAKDEIIKSVAFQEVMDELAIDSVAIPTTDLPTVVSLAQQNIPAELLQANASGPDANPAESIDQQYQAENPINRKDVALSGHQVRIQADGSLTGRIHRLNQNGEPTRIRRLNVFLVQNNQVIGQAPVDELGTFNFYDVEDGVYSFVAAGLEGIAAFTMQAVSGPDLTGVADQLLLPVAMTTSNMGGSGAGGIVGGKDAWYANDQAEDYDGEDDNGEATDSTTADGSAGETTPDIGDGDGVNGGGGGGGTTGTGGGTAGGGGFGGGGSGIGELLGVAALGVGLYALSESDNNNNNRRVSPSTP